MAFIGSMRLYGLTPEGVIKIISFFAKNGVFVREAEKRSGFLSRQLKKRGDDTK